jgi:hypothetical protein
MVEKAGHATVPSEQRKKGRMGGRMDGRKDERAEGRTDEWAEGRKDGRKDGRMGGMREGEKVRRTEGRKDMNSHSYGRDGRDEGRKKGRNGGMTGKWKEGRDREGRKGTLEEGRKYLVASTVVRMVAMAAVGKSSDWPVCSRRVKM